MQSADDVPDVVWGARVVESWPHVRVTREKRSLACLLEVPAKFQITEINTRNKVSRLPDRAKASHVEPRRGSPRLDKRKESRQPLFLCYLPSCSVLPHSLNLYYTTHIHRLFSQATTQKHGITMYSDEVMMSWLRNDDKVTSKRR